MNLAWLGYGYIYFCIGVLLQLVFVARGTFDKFTGDASIVVHTFSTLFWPLFALYYTFLVPKLLWRIAKAIWFVLSVYGRGTRDVFRKLLPRRAPKITVPRAIVVDTDRKQV